MITKYVEFNIICDICEIEGCNCKYEDWASLKEKITHKNYSFMLPPSEKGVRDMRKIAKEYGWKRRNDKDICPRCWEKLK